MTKAKGHTENSSTALRPRDPSETERRVTEIRIAMAENRYGDALRAELAERWGITEATVSTMATEASRRNRYSSEEQETLVRAHQARVVAALEEDRHELRSIAEEERSTGSNRTAVEALRGSTAALEAEAKILGLGQAKSAGVQIALIDQRGEVTKDADAFMRRLLLEVAGCATCSERVLATMRELSGDVKVLE